MNPETTPVETLTSALTRANAAGTNHTDVIVTAAPNDQRMVLADSAARPVTYAGRSRRQPRVKWLFDAAGPTWEPSRDDARARNQATVIAAKALALGLAPGAQIMELRNGLERERPKPQAQYRRAEISGLSVACAYMRHAVAGEMFAVVDGELANPLTLTLDSEPDAVASFRDGRWVFDVLSLAKRFGQFRSDCGAGRVQRCLRLAERLAVEEQASSLVRVYGLQVATEPVAVVEVRLVATPAAVPARLTDVPNAQPVELSEHVEVAS